MKEKRKRANNKEITLPRHRRKHNVADTSNRPVNGLLTATLTTWSLRSYRLLIKMRLTAEPIKREEMKGSASHLYDYRRQVHFVPRRPLKEIRKGRHEKRIQAANKKK